jgi:tetratricopeptide (TPR) repeat protein
LDKISVKNNKNQLELAVEAAHEQLDGGDAATALDTLEAALAHAGADVTPLPLAEALGLLGVALRALERDLEARDVLDRAIRLLEGCPVSNALAARVLAGLLEDRAEVDLSSHAYSEAQRLLTRAIELRRACDESIGAETWLALSEAMQRAGNCEEALCSLDHAKRAALHDGDLESAALSEEMRADIELEDPDSVAAATRSYASAEKKWRQCGDHEGVVRCLLGRARAAERCDDEELIQTISRELDVIGEHDLARQLRDGDVG